ncbi:alpha-amylase [Dichomitus squalens]|nr:alpha-amylase [Dichomitus squalens]
MLRFLVLLLFITSVFAATADQWRSRTIYQLLTDRFATTDGHDPHCNATARQYCGGTWKGIINKLDYIQDLGFDAVWISPVVANIEGNTSYGEAYHGYWTRDMTALNPHFGDASDLQALSAELHRRNMLFMVDIVVNHMASASDPPDYNIYQPFSSQSSYHTECFIQDWQNQTNVEQCWLGDTSVPLVDLNTEDDDVVNTLNAWVKDLVTTYSIDGLRVDTVRHIRQDFWPGFADAAGVFILGEVQHPNTSYVADYTHKVDGVLDYPTWYSLVPAFTNTSGNITDLARKVWEAQAQYKTGELLVGSFLENHDNPRLPSFIQDNALIKNAITWPFMNDGIPILYQGQEQTYAGGDDPENREALWLSQYIQQRPLVTHVKILNSARRAAMAYNANFLKTPATLFAVSQKTLAISKPPLLTLLTNVGSSSTPNWNVPDAGYKPGETLVDVLTCNTITVDKNGGVIVAGHAGNPQVLLPASALSPKGTMCSNIATGTGEHQVSSATHNTPGGGDDLRSQIGWAMSLAIPLTLLFLASQTTLFLG